MGWPVEADGLRRLLHWLHDTYPGLPPIYITENGRACDDVVGERRPGARPRPDRYLEDHLRAVAHGARPRASTCAATTPGR